MYTKVLSKIAYVLRMNEKHTHTPTNEAVKIKIIVYSFCFHYGKEFIILTECNNFIRKSLNIRA